MPAPLYTVDGGQVARIERDGTTRTLITEETTQIPAYPPISAFALSPSGQIVYVVGDMEADRLVRIGPDGKNQRTIYEVAGHELSDFVWTPDGAFIYMRLLNNLTPPDIPSGVYRIPAEGGKLELVQADDPVDNPANPTPTISGYRPFAWSPDGSRLLVEIFSLYYDGCSLGVLPAAGGALVRLSPAEGNVTYCGEAAWSPAGDRVYFLAGPQGDGVGPTIWRGDAASGVSEPILAADVLARAPRVLADGSIRFFRVRLAPEAAPSFTLAEVPATGGEPRELGQPFDDLLSLVLWAPDDSGVVIEVQPKEKSSVLQWLPAEGGAPVNLPTTEKLLRGLAWEAKD